MVDPGNLLACLRKDGFAVRQACGRLFVSPGSKLSADQRREVDACKDDLVELLQEGRPSVFHGIMPPVPDGPLPPLLIDLETDSLAAWLSDTPPPTTPIVLQRNRYGLVLIVVDDPALFWRYARQELADGVRGEHGRMVLALIRRVKSALEKGVSP
jgi:hypothetical protein